MQEQMLMPWRTFLQEWRDAESLYMQTVVTDDPCRADKARERIRVIEELLKRANGVDVPDTKAWDREFKRRMDQIVMRADPFRSALVNLLEGDVAARRFIPIYGNKLGV